MLGGDGEGQGRGEGEAQPGEEVGGDDEEVAACRGHGAMPPGGAARGPQRRPHSRRGIAARGTALGFGQEGVEGVDLIGEVGKGRHGDRAPLGLVAGGVAAVQHLGLEESSGGSSDGRTQCAVLGGVGVVTGDAETEVAAPPIQGWAREFGALGFAAASGGETEGESEREHRGGTAFRGGRPGPRLQRSARSASMLAKSAVR